MPRFRIEKNPSTVFVGTGEGNLSLDSFAGVGLYRIDNADQANPTVNGPFETRVAGTGTSASNGHAFLGTGINRIAVDPNNDNRIFIGNIWAFGAFQAKQSAVADRLPLWAFTSRPTRSQRRRLFRVSMSLMELQTATKELQISSSSRAAPATYLLV